MIVPGILGHYTSLTTHSTPAILRLMVDCHCILRPDTAALAQNLLLLYVVLARLSARLLARTKWLAALLSACRPSDLTDFDRFYIENKQDMARCVCGLI